MEIASLALKVDHSDVGKGTAELGKLSEAAGKSEGSTSNLHSAVRSMTGGMIGASAVIGTTTAMLLDMYRHTDLMREKAQDMAHAMTSAGVTAQTLGERLRGEMTIMQDLEAAQGKGIHALDRMDVIKARLYALGPDYRKMIDDEVMGYSDLLKVIEKVNIATMKRIELQIRDQEKQVTKAMKPGWVAGLGAMLNIGGSTGLGGYLWSRGLDADLQKLDEENKKLDKLFEDRAKLMDKSEFKAKKGDGSAGIWTDRRPYRDMIEDLQGLKILHEKTVPDFQIATTAAQDFERTLKALHQAMAEFDQVQSWADPLEYGLRSLNSDRNKLDANRGLLGEGGYLKGLEKLRQEELRLRAESGDTWAIIGYTVTQNSGMASNAIAGWMDNLDGLGRSWKTLGDTVRNVIADMLRQMERAILEQQVMNQAMGWLGGLFTPEASVTTAITGYIDPGGYDPIQPRASGGSVYSGSSYLVGEQGPEIFTPGQTGYITPNRAIGGQVNNVAISVKVDTKGSNVSAEEGGQSAVKLGQMMRGVVNQWATEQSRSGGLLARA
ncbi:hypothetical protein [Geothrix terrae]|uniref:hypothetical protein n=1 Tax=Geothrix terrae TaxID=2922720 RepID=UPI001FAC0C80|nr:hypothetical protein [Geothrix terrae]